MMKNYISVHGIPKKLVADRGTEFTSIVFKQLCHLYNIQLHLTSAKSSTGNSPVERLHSTLVEIYRVLKSKNPTLTSKELMDDTIITYNNSIHSTTQLTPFELKNGHYQKEEAFPPDKEHKDLSDHVEQQRKDFNKIRNLVYMRNKRIKESYISRLNQNRKPPEPIEINEIIYEKNNRRTKLAPRFQKHQAIKDNKITVQTTKRKIHKSKIKKLCKFPGITG